VYADVIVTLANCAPRGSNGMRRRSIDTTPTIDREASP
jgi:hypothetical protein